jgi:hypothetical protein
VTGRHNVSVLQTGKIGVATGLTDQSRWLRFEKSLYDLIKGLRNHKDGEDEYVQSCLRECKAEIKSQDMGRHSVLNSPGQLRMLNLDRQKGNCTPKADLPGNVRLRYVMGLLPCPGSNVLLEIPSKTSGILRGGTEFPPRYGSADVGNKYVEEGPLNQLLETQASQDYPLPRSLLCKD